MKLYFEAEQFIKPSNARNGSLQSRIFNNGKLTNNPKHVYALVFETLKYKPYILEVIKKSKIKQGLSHSKRLKISEELLLLLVHDLVFSKQGRIQSGKHPIKEEILKHKTRLSAEFTKLKLRYKVKLTSELPVESHDDETPVRWFRINTIKLDSQKFFEKHPFFKTLQPVASFQEITEPGYIYCDEYIPNLFGIHPKEKLTSTDAYKLGEVIIQDRASCFPAHILNEVSTNQHKQIIDATAAPGNKTTHAASYLANANGGVVYAFERDDKRVKILKTMCEKATGKSDLIHVTHADFTTTKPEDFPEVTGLIVDPSCSGSGIFGRSIDNQEQENDEEIDQERLAKLAAFQFTIVKHALSFPLANRVVYSTCSVHPHENERVVVDLLQDNQIKLQGWKLDTRENVLKDWPRRGWKEEFTSISNDDNEREKLAGGCVRSMPKEDGGIGFFAACFVRGSANKNSNELKQVQSDVEDFEEWNGFD